MNEEARWVVWNRFKESTKGPSDPKVDTIVAHYYLGASLWANARNVKTSRRDAGGGSYFEMEHLGEFPPWDQFYFDAGLTDVPPKKQYRGELRGIKPYERRT